MYDVMGALRSCRAFKIDSCNNLWSSVHFIRVNIHCVLSVCNYYFLPWGTSLVPVIRQQWAQICVDRLLDAVVVNIYHVLHPLYPNHYHSPATSPPPPISRL